MYAGPYTSRAAERILWKEEFRDIPTVQKNNGVLIGDPVVRDGVTLDGVTQHASYAIPPDLLFRERLSFVLEFWPDSAFDVDASIYLYDSTNGSRYHALKANAAASFILQIMLGNTVIAAVPSATYGPYWRVGERNILIVSSNGTSTDAWLNGTQVLTADPTAWIPKQPVSLFVGASYVGTFPLDGMIKSLSIHGCLLEQADADAIQDGSLFRYMQRSSLWLDTSTATASIIPGAADLLTDGDMEAVGVAAWTPWNADLTKETGTPYEGNQCLRVAYNGTTNPFAHQAVQTIGRRYRAIGVARSDGTAVPQFSETAAVLWTGTTSTDWQMFDVTFTAVSTSIRLRTLIASAGYAEFDAVSVRPVLDRTLDKSRNGYPCLLGDGFTAAEMPTFEAPGFMFDDVDDYLTLPADPTGTFTVAWKRSGEATVFESDLTTWNKIKTSGDFAGLLDYLAWWQFTLSSMQQRDLEYAWAGGRA